MKLLSHIALFNKQLSSGQLIERQNKLPDIDMR